MPGGAARELALFEQDDVVPAHLGEVIGHAAANDAAADDDDAGVLGNGAAGRGRHGGTCVKSAPEGAGIVLPQFANKKHNMQHNEQ